MWALRMGFEGFPSSIALPFVTIDAFRQDCSYHFFCNYLGLCSIIFIFIFIFFLFGGKKRNKEKDIVD